MYQVLVVRVILVCVSGTTSKSSVGTCIKYY